MCFWGVGAVAAAADLVTKHLVFQRLPDLHSAPVVVVKGFLRIVHSENRGGVFGLAQGSWAWLVFGVVAAALVVWFAHCKGSRSLVVQVALGLVLAGAIGNVFDRVVLGHVRDFIDVCYWPGRHWPAFNVADSAICVGAACLAVYALFFAPKPQQESGVGREARKRPRRPKRKG